MRTIVDIPDAQIEILNKISKEQEVSRAEIIRRALTNYIMNNTKIKHSFKSAFGIWKNKKLDSLTFQRKLRDEWGK